MAGSLIPEPTRAKSRPLVIHCSLVLVICMPSIRVPDLRAGFYAGRATSNEAAQDNQQTRRLEPGKPIERELAGGQSHSYQLALDAGQYAKLVVDQRGIDVVAQMSGPDGKQIAEFDSERILRAQESVSLVAEATGNYRLIVRPKQKGAIAGSYEIRLEELRAATDDDRALHEARKLYMEFARLFDAGKYDEARPLIERALEIRERVLGPNHRDVAAAVHNLGFIHSNKGEYDKAEQLYQRALDIWEKVLGPEHPDVALATNGLANAYTSKGDYAKAEELYLRALNIWDKALGPKHLVSAHPLHNLGAIHYAKGEYAQAESFYQRALAIKEGALEPEHPEVARTINNLAILYYHSRDYLKAEPLMQRALKIREKTLGAEHPDVGAACNNLALLYYERGDDMKAKPLYLRALDI
jgi:tetratricopeptide (TPR) repeat protein